MNLRAYVAVLVKRGWLIVSVLVLSLAAAAASILLMTPTYRATAQLFVSTQISSGNLNQELFQGSNFSSDRVKSYSELVNSPTVLEPVIAELNLPVTAPELAARVTAKVPLETVLIDISATSDSPEGAAALANAVSNSLANVVGQLETSTTRGSSPVKATVVTPAVVPPSPAFPSIPVNMGLGLLIGLIVGVGLAVTLENLNTSFRDPADLAEISGLPVLAAVTRDPRRDAAVIVADGEAGQRSETYRQLRTNLQFAAVDQTPRVIVVTSAVTAEGKSSVAGNLAVALSQVGVRVCLVDGDLRRPSVAGYFDLDSDVGLSTALVGEASLDQILQPVNPGLAVITSGLIPPNPAELLSSRWFPMLLTELRERFDTVIIDAPPTLPAADAAVLAAIADGVVFVVHAGKTSRHHVDRALNSLRQVNARILGTVLNMVPAKGPKSHYWYGSGYDNRVHAKPAKHAPVAATRPIPRTINGVRPERSSVITSAPPHRETEG